MDAACQIPLPIRLLLRHDGGVHEIRVLTPDDWAVWRRLRLAALTDAPHAFAARLADWTGEGDAEERWRGLLAIDGAHNVVALLDGHEGSRRRTRARLSRHAHRTPDPGRRHSTSARGHSRSETRRAATCSTSQAVAKGGA
jgi:hypothetical protein